MLCLYEKEKINNIKSFMRYVVLRWQKERQMLAYRIYITDALQTIAENTAKMVDGGKYLPKRYYDVISNNVQKEEKAEDIINKYKTLGLVV